MPIKLKGQETYLHRTIDCLLTPKRDQVAAQRSFRKDFRSEANPIQIVEILHGRRDLSSVLSKWL